nr:hypothetical protein [Actinoplanes atraurantiacus]
MTFTDDDVGVVVLDSAEVRDRAARLRRKVQADREQRLIDAEVEQTRRTLLRAVRQRVSRDTVAFCDPDFLAVGDQPALYRAVLDAAVTAGGAMSVDLQTYDNQARVLHIAAPRFRRRVPAVLRHRRSGAAHRLRHRPDPPRTGPGRRHRP